MDVEITFTARLDLDTLQPGDTFIADDNVWLILDSPSRGSDRAAIRLTKHSQVGWQLQTARLLDFAGYNVKRCHCKLIVETEGS